MPLPLDTADRTCFWDSEIYCDHTASGRQCSLVVKSLGSKPDYQEFLNLHCYLIAARPSKLTPLYINFLTCEMAIIAIPAYGC